MHDDHFLSEVTLNRMLSMPAWKAAVCFGIGIILGAQIDIPPALLLSLLVLLGIVLLFVRRREQTFTVLLFAALVTAGGLYYHVRQKPVPTSLSRLADTRVKTTLLCTVESSPVIRKKGFSLFGNVIRAWNDSGFVTTAGPVYIRWYPGYRVKYVTIPAYGDTLLLTGRLRTARSARNPGEFDFRKYLERHGTAFRFSASGRGYRAHGAFHGFSINRVLNHVRNGIKSWITRFYPKDTAPILSALLLGLRNELDPEINEAFISTGVIHVLAVSGLHVGMILAIIWVLLSRMTERVRIFVTMPLLLFYALLCGAAPPVLRATVIVELYLFGRLLSRLSDSINLLGVAALVNLVLRPDDILYASFHLSYAAVLGIILIYPRLRTGLKSRLPGMYERKLRGYVADLLLVSLAAGISTLPFVLLHFGRFSFIGIVANIIVVPGVFAIVAGGVASLLLGSIWFPAGAFIADNVDAIVHIVTSFVKMCATLPGAGLYFPPPDVYFFICYAFSVLILFGITRWRLGVRMLATALLIGFFTLTFFSARGEHLLRLVFLDVGQGDAIFIRGPDGSTALVDCGASMRGFDAGRSIIVPYLQRSGVSSLDALILTHADDDHIGGAPAILSSISVERIIHSTGWSDRGDARLVDSIAAARGIPVLIAFANQKLRISPLLNVFVLNPARTGETRSRNDLSLVLKLQYGKTSFLLTGDAEQKSERWMIGRYDGFLKADVLKVGHHGSLSSTDPAFLARVRPRYAVISCGFLNKFRHPKPRVLKRLRRIGAVIRRTDKRGAIIFQSDGSRIEQLEQ